MTRSCDALHPAALDSAAPDTPSREAATAALVARIEARCAARGVRMTGQRRVIARLLAEAEDHPDVEQVWRRCAEIDRRISIATVYRTVRLLAEAGVIDRHNFHDGRTRYDMPRERHDHLIDRKTGRVVDFTSEEMERLQAALAKKLGYRLVAYRLELYGEPLSSKSEGRGAETSRPSVPVE